MAAAGYRALCDRACAFLAQRALPTPQTDLLAHVYGSAVPAGLAETLVVPLLNDVRLCRHADGTWDLADPAPASDPHGPFVALAIATTGGRPARDRVLAISALRVAAEHRATLQHAPAFEVQLNPEVRVPRYAARRGRLDRALFESQPRFAAIAEEFFAFVGDLPVCAQEAAQAWAFISNEARRMGRATPTPRLVDVNRAADSLLGPRSKPTLALVAAALGVPGGPLDGVGAEARTVARVIVGLLARAELHGATSFDVLVAADAPARAPRPLRSPRTVGDLPDTPGVYVMRDDRGEAVYVGKARRLQRRMAAYVDTPLGVSRRLEGLADGVQTLEPHTCDNELEALVLEAREIRALQPRFNTQRASHPPRYWLCLPPAAAPGARRRPRALRRITLCNRECDESLGPFRTEREAEAARLLTRRVFDLDTARTTRASDYETRLAQAWAFLGGATDGAVQQLRANLAAAQATGDFRAAQRLQASLRACLTYDYTSAVLPADPRHATYAIVRPDADGLEVFRLRDAQLVAHQRGSGLDPVSLYELAEQVVATAEPRTGPEDATVVLRWLGAQRLPARLVPLPADAEGAVTAIHRAALQVADDLLLRAISAADTDDDA